MESYPKESEEYPYEATPFVQDEDSKAKGAIKGRAKWKFGPLACAGAAGGVFVLNLAIVIAYEARSGFRGVNHADGQRLLYSGDCTKTKNLNIGVHLIINLFSTILLGASNYCMQRIAAPTRSEIDRAHARSRWVDIGVPSIRNLKYISRGRQVMWILLGLSSIPLHLFYNSTVFSSLGIFKYDVFSANEAFANNPLGNISEIEGFLYYAEPVDWYRHNISGDALLDSVNLAELKRIETDDCLKAYAVQYQTSHSNLFLVVANETSGFNNSESVASYEARNMPDFYHYAVDRYGWICNHSSCVETTDPSYMCENAIPCIQDDIGAWQPFKKEIQYCLSEHVDERCQLAYSVHLAIIVLLMGAAKTVLMLFVAFSFRDQPLLTIGDAVASYIQRPDSFTQGACLIDRSDVQKHFEDHTLFGLRKKYAQWPVRRYRAASIRRKITCSLLFVLATSVSIAFLVYGIKQNVGKFTNIWGLGFGAVNPATIIQWWMPDRGPGGLVLNVVVANSPQLVFSFLYLTWNGLVTVMALASEWSSYATARKGLRVSRNPKGAQRSTYFLQLPYRIGIPLMILSGTMHWLISQSLFLVKIDVYDARDLSKGTQPTQDDSSITCGFSPAAILVTIVVGTVSFVSIIALASRRLKSGMPVAGSCSAAIAAACQPTKASVYKEEAVFEKVQWGVMRGTEGSIGHCGFSADYVDLPENGELYE